MYTKLTFLDPYKLFMGFRFSINNKVENLKTYDKNKDYPKVYLIEIGLLFANMEIKIG